MMEINFNNQRTSGSLKAAYIIFKEYPILGAATKGFRNQCYNNLINKEGIVCTIHPHSPYMQLLSETEFWEL